MYCVWVSSQVLLADLVVGLTSTRMYCVLVSSQVLLADLVVGLSSTTHVLCIGQFASSTRRSSGRSNLDLACIVYWSEFYSQI